MPSKRHLIASLSNGYEKLIGGESARLTPSTLLENMLKNL
jgi:hypothetical protein